MSKRLTTSFVKEEYNRQNKDAYGGEYEFNRWFNTRTNWESYRMQYLSQRFHTKDISFKSYFEFGVGPGTWTKLFLNQTSEFMLLDISEEMLKQAKNSLGIRKNIHYVVGDVLRLGKKNHFDLVFSSRAMKYVPDKEKLFKNIYDSLTPRGECVIITQSADTVMQRIYRSFGKKEELLHTGDMRRKDIYSILTRTGFKDIRFYPVEIKVGIPGICIFHGLSRFIWNMFYKKEMNGLSSLLSGSYLIRMKK